MLMRSRHGASSWRLRAVCGSSVALAIAILLAPATVRGALPDDRVYEQTTAANKNGAMFGVVANSEDLGGGQSWMVSRDGRRIMANALSAFGEGDPGSVISTTQHMIERSADGWRTRPFSPAPLAPSAPPSSASGVLLGPHGATDDFSELVFSSTFKLDPRDLDDPLGDGPSNTRTDVYGFRFGPAGESLDLLSCPAAPAPACGGPTPLPTRDASNGVNVLSADGTLALFETSEPFLGASGPQIYARVGDELRWISQPLDTPEPAGATQLTGTPSTVTTASDSSGQPNTPGAVGGWANAISHNGSRVFFASPSGISGNPLSRVYVRIADERTLEVSRVRGGEPVAQKVKFRGASTDGNRALISTQQALLPAAGGSTLETDPNALEDLYVWAYDEQGDPSNDAPTALTRVAGLPQLGTGPAPDGQVALNVLGVSDDLTRVYFVSRAAASPFDTNLYLAELPAADARAGSVRWIANVFTGSSASATFGGCLNPRSAANMWGTCARATSSGRYLVFDSPMPLTLNDDEPGCAPATTIPEECKHDVFVYDAEEDTLERASVGSGGRGNDAFDATLFGDVASTASSAASSRRALHVSESGEAYFVTTEALNPDDINGKLDVYAYSGGAAKLISSGKSELNSLYAGASSDGRDVFFLTAEGLVPEDTDGAADFYDARVGGGFDRAQPTRCDPLADGCQAGGSPPTRPSIGSVQPGGADVKSVPRPRISLARLSARARRHAARTGKLTARVTTNGAGTVKVRARARLRRQGRARTRTVATRTARATKAGTIRVRLRLNAAARRQLRADRKLSLTLRATFPEAFAQARSVALRLPSKKSGASARHARGDTA